MNDEFLTLWNTTLTCLPRQVSLNLFYENKIYSINGKLPAHICPPFFIPLYKLTPQSIQCPENLNISVISTKRPSATFRTTRTKYIRVPASSRILSQTAGEPDVSRIVARLIFLSAERNAKSRGISRTCMHRTRSWNAWPSFRKRLSNDRDTGQLYPMDRHEGNERGEIEEQSC